MWINKSSRPRFIYFLFSLPSFKVKAPQAATPSFSAMPIPFQRMAEWSELPLRRKLPRRIFFPETESKAARAVGQGAGESPYTRWVNHLCLFDPTMLISNYLRCKSIVNFKNWSVSSHRNRIWFTWTIEMIMHHFFFHEISSTNAHDQLIFLRWIHRVYWTRYVRNGASIFQV